MNANMLLSVGEKLHVVMRRDEDGNNDGSIIKIPRDGQAYCIFKAPRYSSDEEWEHNANLIVEALEGMVKN